LPYDESLTFQLPQLPKDDPRDPYEEFLRRPDRPTAIFTTVDFEAINVLQTAQRIGLRVPEDLALIGFDSLRLTKHIHPPLTTVSQSCRDMGMRAAHLLINRIEGQAGPGQHIELPTTLIVRESCGARLHVKNLPRDAKPVR
jgi:DNA-binding LacI/PurR family transcriptional regulator